MRKETIKFQFIDLLAMTLILKIMFKKYFKSFLFKLTNILLLFVACFLFFIVSTFFLFDQFPFKFQSELSDA